MAAGRWWRIGGVLIACVLAAGAGTWLGTATRPGTPVLVPADVARLPAGVPFRARTLAQDPDAGTVTDSPVGFRPDGLIVHLTRGRRGLAWRDPVADRDVATVELPRNVVETAFGADGRTAWAADSGGTLQVLDLSARLRTGAIDVGGSPTAVAVSPDGRRLYVGDGSGAVVVVEPAAGRVVARWRVPEPVTDLAVGPDGRRLAVLARPSGTATDLPDGTLSVLDTGSGRVVGSAPVPSGPFFAPSGRTAVAIGATAAYAAGDGVTVLDLRTGTHSRPSWTPGPVLALTLSPAGDRLYAASYVQTPGQLADTTALTVVDPAAGRVIGRTDPFVAQPGTAALTVSPDAARLMLASDTTGQTELFDLRQ